MDQQQSSLSSQEWPSLSPSPNVESEKLVKNKKCDECPFVTHKTYNLKNHKKIHVKVTIIHYLNVLNNKTHTKENSVECLICKKRFSKKSNLVRHNTTEHQSKKVVLVDGKKVTVLTKMSPA